MFLSESSIILGEKSLGDIYNILIWKNLKFQKFSKWQTSMLGTKIAFSLLSNNEYLKIVEKYFWNI